MNPTPLNNLSAPNDWKGSVQKNRDLVLVLALGGILMAILVPLPGPVMDVLLGVNIAISVLILLTVVYLKSPLEFAAFPSMLLIATLYRLALNIATTRLILSKAGQEGGFAAGKVVNFFGEFVSASNAVVGFIIFAVLAVIQFVVVTKGASRIAEVAARFTLDRMPGSQMAIDADLTAGNISASEARLAREDLAHQADFYGAMDGASKFVRGDAIAAVLITSINIFGGIAIGVFQSGMSIGESVSVFSVLAIGDGIATQLPALFISVAAGLMVTRASSKGQIGHVMVGQVFANPRALLITAMVLLSLASVGLSPMALGSLSLVLVYLAYSLSSSRKKSYENPVSTVPAEQVHDQEVEASSAAISHAGQNAFQRPLVIELGPGLRGLISSKEESSLSDSIENLRNEIREELGIDLPPVKVSIERNLGRQEYRILLREIPTCLTELKRGKYFVTETDRSLNTVPGDAARHPVSSKSGKWIDADEATMRRSLGYHCESGQEILIGQLRQITNDHAQDLLTRNETKILLEEIHPGARPLVAELIPEVFSVAEVQRVFQALLSEKVSLRDLEKILEALGEVAIEWPEASRRPVEAVVEKVRNRVSRSICGPLADSEGVIRVVTLDPESEQCLFEARIQGNPGSVPELAPERYRAILQSVSHQMDQLERGGYPAVVLCPPELRISIKKLLEKEVPKASVLSYNEIAHGFSVVSGGMARADFCSTESTLSGERESTFE